MIFYNGRWRFVMRGPGFVLRSRPEGYDTRRDALIAVRQVKACAVDRETVTVEL
jgi:hypothetical protein